MSKADDIARLIRNAGRICGCDARFDGTYAVYVTETKWFPVSLSLQEIRAVLDGPEAAEARELWRQAQGVEEARIGGACEQSATLAPTRDRPRERPG